MLKRVIAVLLFLVFGLSQSGLRLEIHTCFGEIRSIGFFESEKCPCNPERDHPKRTESLTRSNTCCKTQSLKYSVEDSYLKIRVLGSNAHFPIPNLFHDSWKSIATKGSPFRLISIGSPPYYGPPIYLVFHSLRV
jgi:hypothetical protein